MSERHIVMFSGGIAGDEMARRVKASVVDPATITLLFADTKIEDEDLYRFRDQSARHHNLHLEIIADGRTPFQVFRDVKFLGNTRADPCSRILKRALMRRWLEENCEPTETMVYVGYDWTEDHRSQDIEERWKPWRVAFPLAERPYEFKDAWLQRSRDNGVEPPRLYRHNFPHNNCGGGCVKAGQAQWALLLNTFPERYARWEGEEQDFREENDKDVAILRDRRGGKTRPLTLKEFRQRLEREATAFDQLDWGACSCMGGAA